MASNHRTEPAPAGKARVAAFVVAFLLVVGSGVAFQQLNAHYARSVGSVAIPEGTLGDLPLTIGPWQGKNIPLDDHIVQATDTDDHVNRTYFKTGSDDRVGVWIAYGLRLRDLHPHRPEVCYTGAGWTLDTTELAEVPLEDGTSLPCQIQTFYRGGLQTSKIVVLNYYLVNGEYCANDALLRERAAGFSDEDYQYSMQVQFASNEEPLGRSGKEVVKAFTQRVGPMIQALITEAVAQASENDASL